MPSHGPPSPNPQPGTKRQRQESYDGSSPQNGQPSPTEQQGDALAGLGGAGASSKAGQSSNFRNVSACNRCRLRKNRCDQKLPSCASCAKAGVACVGYDPITKKEIPRSYVFYLETRVEQLEKLLNANNISFPPAENLELCSRPGVDASSTLSGGDSTYSGRSEIGERAKSHSQVLETLKAKKAGQSPAMLNIVSPSKPRSLASASGVSFARVVFAAVQYSVSDSNTAGDRSGGRSLTGNATSMRDSFFGLHAKPTIQPAPFPAKEVGLRLVHLYFEHANPQIPILHRGEFMKVFNHAYETGGQDLAPRELYLLNMVFAIGCGVIVGEPVKTEASDGDKMAIDEGKGQSQPEEYHASAIVHLESCLSFSAGGLEVLQAVLLLANFALLRPVPPGLWYITGVAVRLAVDLGLHHEDGTDVEGMPPDPSSEMDTTDGDTSARGNGSQERGRRLWVRDMRRRLWWCTYSFDRLVRHMRGPALWHQRPSHHDRTTIASRRRIHYAERVPGAPEDDDRPSYKHVAHHYFRLRMLQSEILQVLQYNQAQLARVGGNQGKQYPEMHTHLPSPLPGAANAPTRSETGVAFSTEFLELNYWQAIIMLYRQSLSVPAMFEGEYNTSDEVNSPTAFTAELREDEDRIYLKVAEAGQKILRIYRQLHLSGLVSYTYLSTHHLFMAGISYLYAIWHSPVVRSRLSMDEVDFTVLAAKSVFTDMIDKCPPAETCRDAFDRTAKATIKMASSSGGFGPASQQPRRQRRETVNWASAPDAATLKPPSRRPNQSEQAPFQFDLSISDNLSSPSLSATGEMHTPPLGKSKTFETDTFISGSRSQSGPSPGNRTISHDGAPPSIRLLFLRRPSHGEPGINTGARATMEFLQNLGATPNGDMNNMEQAQLDLGFGINWEGMHNDYGEGQQINPFDTFFFGGQQTGGGGGGGGGNGGGAAGSGGNNGNGAA
ncbi:hypothetical protein ACCO45_011221 [Purpureocillium lilacinum]|uniref:Uncharacterized protein n=1 Tax=Purpureocillium lilacinum TaxID=33203 RepID=A0ACC4DJZ7_PURLI